MGQKAFIAKNGLISGNLTVNSTIIQQGTDVFLSALDVRVSNTTSNSAINRTSVTVSNATSNAIISATQLRVANSTVSANHDLAQFIVGASIANATGIYVGANTIANAAGFFSGLSVANISGFYVGANTSANATHIVAPRVQAGVNVVANATTFFVANATVSTVLGNNFLQISNATANVFIDQGKIVVGLVNATTVSATAVNTADITATGQVNANTFFAASSANIAGSIVYLNASGVYTSGLVNADSISSRIIAASALISTADINIQGQTNTSTVNIFTSLNVADAVAINATGVWTTGTVNCVALNSDTYVALTSVTVGPNVFLTTSGLKVGNSTVNAVVNSTSITLSSATGSVSLGQTITSGFILAPYNAGTISSGTLTPNPLLGNYQFYTNNGAHTLAAPANDCSMDILITNGATAGAITLSGFTVSATNSGDALTTTNTNKFLLSLRRINGVSTYVIKALQ